MMIEVKESERQAMKKEQMQGEIEALNFKEDTYDFDGMIRLADCEEAALIFTFEDEDDGKHYMNRYELLAAHMSIEQKLNRIHHYLEEDETHGLFVSFAVVYEGQLQLFNGRSKKGKEVDMGELELGNHMIYGMLIRYIEGEYLFDEVLYFDGENKSHSWAERVLDAGELTFMMKETIMEFED